MAVRPPPAAALLIDGDRLRRPDGGTSALVAADDLDIDALDPPHRQAIVEGFSRLCRSIELPLQIVLQVRRWPPPPGDEPFEGAAIVSGAESLWRASSDHRRHVLATHAAYRRSVLFVVSSRPADEDHSLDSGVRQVVEALRAVGLSARRLDAGEITEVLRTVWHAQPPTEPCDTSMQPRLVAHPTFAEVGDILVRGYTLRQLPGMPVEAGWLRPLLQVRTECDIALHLQPVDASNALKHLGRRLRDLHADRLVEVDRELIGDVNLAVGTDAAAELRFRLARNEARPLAFTLAAAARARSAEELTRSSDVLRAAFHATLAGSRVAHLQHVETAISTWPVGINLVSDCKLVDSAAAATCTPWSDVICDDAGGHRLGRSLGNGTPVCVAPFDTDHHVNANVAVFAASGQGKSYAIGTLVLEAVTRSIGTVIIDPEGEYEHLVSVLGGEYLRLIPGSDAALNIFDITRTAARDEDGESAADVAMAVVDLVNVLCSMTLDDSERAAVDIAATQALQKAADDRRMPVLSDLLADLTASSPRAAFVLRRFCLGPVGELFSRPTTVELDAPVVGISFRDLKPDLIPAATFVVAEWLWAAVRRMKLRRHLIFDEVGLLCTHPPLRRLLVQLARRCRKYGTSLIVATQNLTDLLASDEGTVVATNPSIILLGGHRRAETSRMQNVFGLVDHQRRFLESAGRGDFLMIAGSRRLPIRVEAPALFHEILRGGSIRA